VHSGFSSFFNEVIKLHGDSNADGLDELVSLISAPIKVLGLGCFGAPQ